MGHMTQTLTVYFENTDKEVDIDVDCEYEILNDGIGAYEYWGAKCFDKGRNYVNIYSTEWNKTGYSPEEIMVVEKEIEKAKTDWENEVDTSDNGDYPDRDDRD